MDERESERVRDMLWLVIDEAQKDLVQFGRKTACSVAFSNAGEVLSGTIADVLISDFNPYEGATPDILKAAMISRIVNALVYFDITLLKDAEDIRKIVRFVSMMLDFDGPYLHRGFVVKTAKTPEGYAFRCLENACIYHFEYAWQTDEAIKFVAKVIAQVMKEKETA
jgi:hypothetical protein